MSVPYMYYVGLVSNLVFLLLSIFGYLYISNKTGKRYLFVILFAASWLVSGLSYVFLVSGTPADEWYITLIRIITYILFLNTIISLIVELARFKKAE